MARKLKKKKDSIDLQKFGGTDDLGKIDFDGHQHDVQSIEVKSETKLTDDPFEGAVAIIRKFTFGANPQAFKEYKPTKQELFNSHLKGIEIALWRDGMQLNTRIEPQIHFDEKQLRYSIFVGAKPARGHLVTQTPLSLREIAQDTHGI